MFLFIFRNSISVPAFFLKPSIKASYQNEAAFGPENIETLPFGKGQTVFKTFSSNIFQQLKFVKTNIFPQNCSVSDNWHFLRHDAPWGISLPAQGAAPSPLPPAAPSSRQPLLFCQTLVTHPGPSSDQVNQSLTPSLDMHIHRGHYIPPYLHVLSAFCIAVSSPKTQPSGRGVRRGLSQKPANP